MVASLLEVNLRLLPRLYPRHGPELQARFPLPAALRRVAWPPLLASTPSPARRMSDPALGNVIGGALKLKGVQEQPRLWPA